MDSKSSVVVDKAVCGPWMDSGGMHGAREQVPNFHPTFPKLNWCSAKLHSQSMGISFRIQDCHSCRGHPVGGGGHLDQWVSVLNVTSYQVDKCFERGLIGHVTPKSMPLQKAWIVLERIQTQMGAFVPLPMPEFFICLEASIL